MRRNPWQDRLVRADEALSPGPVPSMPAAARSVALFATCIVDQVHPEIAEATVTVLRRLGVTVSVPVAQTCCGQPAFNAGYRRDARAMAAHTLDVLRDAGDVVVPSGSCATMIRVFYAELFEDDPQRHAAALDLAQRTYEFTEYLVDVLGVTDVNATFPARLTVHDACHALRELGLKHQTRALLGCVAGTTLSEAPGAERCCGFGGLFAIKLGPVSEAMASAKAADIQATGADYAVTTDASCMLQINGRLSREGANCRVLHIAQVLAGAPAELGAMQRSGGSSAGHAQPRAERDKGSGP
jgi:L-lactate dehydrogenase complex protein LldE